MPVRGCTTVHVYDAVVLGAGQVSLSVSYHLCRLAESTTCPRRSADGRSRPSPSPSQRRPAAASGGAAGWEACHREDLAASPVRRPPKYHYGSPTSWLSLTLAGLQACASRPCSKRFAQGFVVRSNRITFSSPASLASTARSTVVLIACEPPVPHGRSGWRTGVGTSRTSWDRTREGYRGHQHCQAAEGRPHRHPSRPP